MFRVNMILKLILLQLILPYYVLANDIITEMTMAAREGDINQVRYYIRKGADPNGFDKRGFTALTGASHNGHRDIVEFLINSGADVNLRAKNGTTALAEACFEGHKEVIKLLVEKGADVNAKNYKNGWTPFMNASLTGDKEIIDYLLSKGANINEQTNEGGTALLLVSTVCDADTANHLILRGADPNIKSKSGHTYIDLLSAQGCKGEEAKKGREIKDYLHKNMEEFSAISLILSIIITWTIGLLPPLLIRYVILKRPLTKKSAITICVLFWVFNMILFIVMGSTSKIHASLFIVAFVSYWILRREKKISVI